MSPLGTGVGIWETLLFILMRLFLAALIIIAVIFIARLVKRGSKTLDMHGSDNLAPHFNTSLQLLNDRLAKGEITVDEYQRIKAEIFRK